MQILNCRKKCILFLLFILLHGLCNGQAYKYRFRTINLPEEFQNQYISLVDEDAAGMLWFVTTSGLHRYDGNQVLTFDMQSTPAMPDADIWRLVADSRNHVWVIAHNKLVCFDLQQWRTRIIPFRHPGAALQDVNEIAEGKDGTLYASSGNNLYRVDNDSLEYITNVSPQETGTTAGYIDRIHEPEPGYLLLTTSMGKIVSLHHRQNAFGRPVDIKLRQTSKAFDPFSSGTPSYTYLLNVLEKGPYDVDMKRGLATPLIDLKGIQLLQSNTEIGVNDLEKGSQAISFYKNFKAKETMLVIYNAKHDMVDDLTSVYPSGFKYNMLRRAGYKNGHILIPIKGGIATVSYTSKAFDVFYASMENANSLRSIYKEPGGRLLIGSYLYRFVQFNEASSTSTTRSEGMVTCMLPWQKDTLLISDGGLKWYLPATNRSVTLFSFTDTLVNPYVNCLARENDTSVWVGTNTGFHLINPYTRRILQSSMPGGNQPSKQSVVFDILKVGTSLFLQPGKSFLNTMCLQKAG